MRIIVVGGGVMGASVAYHAARDGAEVTVVDPTLKGRATAAGAGIICPWSSRVQDPDWYRLSSGGARYYPALVARLAEDGETALSYRRVGALCIAGEEGDLDGTEARVRARVAAAPEAGEVTRLDAAQARALFPPLREGTPALHISGAARVDGRLLAEAMLRAATRHGATTLIEPAVALTTAAGRVTGVQLADRVIAADRVVLAAGAWASALLAPLGVVLPVQPQRGQILHLHLPNQDTRNWPVLLPMSSHYLLAFDDSRVVVGATREVGSGFDDRLTAGGVMQVLQQALSVAPGLATATLHELRVGLRPMGPGTTPVLGSVPGWQDLIMANGLGAGGLTMGPYAGALVARAALGLDTEISLDAYGLAA